MARPKDVETDGTTLHYLLEYIPEGVMITRGPCARIVAVSRYGEKLIGLEEGALLGVALHERVNTFRMLHPESLEPAAAEELPLHRSSRSGEIVNDEEWVLERPDKSTVYVLANSGPIRDEDCEVIGAVLAWRDISARKKDEQELRESRERLQRFASHLQALAEESRKRLAQELHDELGQGLAGLKMQLAATRSGLDSQKLAERLDEMINIVDASLEGLRHVLAELRPPVLDKLGLRAAIEWQIERFRERSGTGCSCNLPEQLPELDDATATGVFRILQESLANVSRHAAASHVEVTVKCKEQEFALTVRDNGKGINLDEARRDSFGILGMQERAAALAGSLVIEPIQPHGTQVSLRLDLPKPHQS